MSDTTDRGDDPTPETIVIAEPVKPPAPEVHVDPDTDIDPDEPDADHKPAAKKDARIPLNRHKEILEKERAQRTELERKLAQYEQSGEQANVNAEIAAAEASVAKMDAEYDRLITDGEMAKAAALKQQIRQTERQLAEARSDIKINAAEARAAESARYSIALERIEAAYPTLNPDHDDYNAELSQEVVDFKAMYQARGLTPTAAMQAAVKRVISPTTAKQESATEVTPRVPDRGVAAERKAAAVAKTSKAVAAQPANLSNAGINSDKLGGGRLDAAAVMKLNQKEFAAISEADLSIMRGDSL